MYEALWLIPALPFAGFLALVVMGSRLSKAGVALIGAGSVGASALVAAAIGVKFIVAPPPGNVFDQTLWDWMDVAGFHPTLGLHLDALSVVMIFIVTFVGFLIHVYSTEYMRDDDGYARFFAYLNLFMSAMLVLVLADNLLMLYLGWEGVGLCSYLLIGFWYKAPENARAAIKAFVVTRIGDTAFAVGLFLIFNNLGTINIQEILEKAPQAWPTGSTLATAAALLLLGGALGKSAQLPLQTWLPDAMAGPTPVSALIHAATMVTAGVYLIARMNVLYTLAPIAQTLVAVIGAVTLFIAACSALTQTDIKRALAYSTISQIGYMFLALGVGAWSAAIFHFANHAFFKALLFLSAGAIINSVHHEQNMFKMGGLRRQIPLVFWVFLIGASSLASLPLVTSGFYSKDLILWYAWCSPKSNYVLWLLGTAGAVITALYSFRMVFLVFFGEAKITTHYRPGPAMAIPLVILAVLSIVSGFIQMPEALSDAQFFSKFTELTLPATKVVSVHAPEMLLLLVCGALTVGGIIAAFTAYIKAPNLPAAITRNKLGAQAFNLFHEGWGFDWVYFKILVSPFVRVARAGKGDVIDLIYDLIASGAVTLNQALSLIQNGSVRSYATGVAFGAILTLAILVLT